MQRVKLDENQIAAALVDRPDWTVEHGKLTRTFEFDSYARGVLFASAVAHLAEGMDHHPDITIGYRKVTLAVNTHDVDGISPFDFELARRVEALLGS